MRDKHSQVTIDNELQRMDDERARLRAENARLRGALQASGGDIMIRCRACGEFGTASELWYSEGDCPFTEDCRGIDEDIEYYAEAARLREELRIRNNSEQLIPNCSEYRSAFYAVGDMQLCGHPIACIVSSDDGTSYCGWCEDMTGDITESGGRWDYNEAMRQYDIQQKRACKAEAEVARLREAGNGILDCPTEVLGAWGAAIANLEAALSDAQSERSTDDSDWDMEAFGGLVIAVAMAAHKKLKAGLQYAASGEHQDYPEGTLELGIALDALNMFLVDVVDCVRNNVALSDTAEKGEGR